MLCGLFLYLMPSIVMLIVIFSVVMLSAVAPYSHLGNFDIDFFVFCHRFQIMSLKFTVFERVGNSAVKF